MRKYILTRIAESLIVLFLFLTAVFFLTQIIMPGDFAILIRYGEGVEKVNELRQELGLDLPIGQRYLIWLWDVVRGDLGNSFFEDYDIRNPGTGMTRLPVTTVVGTRAAAECVHLQLWSYHSVFDRTVVGKGHCLE